MLPLQDRTSMLQPFRAGENLVSSSKMMTYMTSQNEQEYGRVNYADAGWGIKHKMYHDEELEEMQK
jgi:hypothetical protein